ncbi:MAG: sulfur-carrier protein [Planctomycetota bacterium]|jgi:molybdopterin synthase sulfur carrier subunit|nr:sulfur-carrier protein [Planctomycetota bacterium]
MSVTVRIPTPLRTLTKGADEVKLEGKNIKDIVENLEANYKGIKERICDNEGQIRRFVNVYLNDEDIRFIDNLKTPVKDGDHISIVPAIAGGNSADK